MKTLKCTRCGREFTSPAPNAKFCTIKCKNSYNLKRRWLRDKLVPEPELENLPKAPEEFVEFIPHKEVETKLGESKVLVKDLINKIKSK